MTILNTSERRLHLVLPKNGLPVCMSVLFALTINFLFSDGHDQQRCVEIVTLCAVAILFLSRLGKDLMRMMPMSVASLLLAFLTAGLASAAMALSMRHAVYEWSSILLLLVLSFAVAIELARNARRLWTLLHWTGIVCGLYSLRLLAMYAAALASGFQVDMYSLVVGFSNPRFLNHTQTALLPLIVLLCMKAPPGGGWRKAWFALAAFWWALLFVCEARASVLALSLGSAGAFGLRRSHARQFLATIACAALAGMVIYALLFILLPISIGMLPLGSPSNVLTRTAADPTSARNLLWNLALELITTHPWLGVGPLHFAHEGATVYTGAHPHNWILQIAAEWGVPAMLCLLSVVVLGTRALLRSGASVADNDVVNQRMLVTFLVACMAIFVDALLSGVIVMPQSQLAVALVLGIACAWVRLQGSTEQHAQPAYARAKRVIVAIIVTMGLCGLIWSVTPDIVQHARGDKITPAEQARNPGAHWPRMWEAGYF